MYRAMLRAMHPGKWVLYYVGTPGGYPLVLGTWDEVPLSPEMGVLKEQEELRLCGDDPNAPRVWISCSLLAPSDALAGHPVTAVRAR